MHKIKGIFVSTLLLLSLLAIIAPVSAGTIHVYPGDDIGAKLGSTVSGDTIYIHAGTYTLSASPNLDNKSLTIIGDGASSTIINFVGADTRLYFYMYPGPSRTINISGITFIGDPTITTARLVYFFNNDSDTRATMNARITDCVFEKASELFRAGAYAANMQSIILENSVLKNGSSVGVYVEDYGNVIIKNCLLSTAGEVGIDSIQYSQTNVQSCTINNSLDGITYRNNATGSVKDSIITNNVVGIRNQSTGTVTAMYNNVWGNKNTNYNGITPGTGSLSVDPRYVDGVDTFYLNQASQCVNSGSDQSSTLGLYNGYTTRADGKWDTGTVDMGYHYKSTRGPPGSSPIAKILEIIKGNKNK
jgi:hypothetical protein